MRSTSPGSRGGSCTVTDGGRSAFWFVDEVLPVGHHCDDEGQQREQALVGVEELADASAQGTLVRSPLGGGCAADTLLYGSADNRIYVASIGSSAGLEFESGPPR